MTVGTGVQLVTNGVKVTEYRPSDNDKSVDILVRFPHERRSLDQIDELRIQTPAGHVPIGNFVARVPAPRVGHINAHRRRARDHRHLQRRRGRAERQRAESDRRRARQDAISVERDLPPEGRGRGAREGRRVPDEGVRHRDLPDLRDPARAVQQVHLGRPGADRRGALDHRRADRADGHGPVVRRGDDRHRRHRQCRRDREQQHRADRHLRPAAARGRAPPTRRSSRPAASAPARSCSRR